MVNGNIITPHPGNSIPKKCPKNTYIPPFKLRAAIPKVQTKIGISNFVRNGHTAKLKVATANMSSTTWPKLLSVRFNPELIKITPSTFEINSIK
ncbi:hypothetical protein [uncultured Methanobrevibacter sp.]|uniref:hypothetical protein n=1 Tax=uncultured Methanobrevibacter sp. TaxID=253161 RepID=UPI0025F78457|nr:hypothetical protein [uncultured Methanobrevibacter sp.]